MLKRLKYDNFIYNSTDENFEIFYGNYCKSSVVKITSRKLDLLKQYIVSEDFKPKMYWKARISVFF